MFRAFVLADDFRAQFGPDAAEAIKTILESVSRSQSIAEVRDRIQERHLRVGIYVCNPDGACTWCNEWLAEAFGRDERDMHGYGWLSSVEPSERIRAKEHWDYCLQSGIPYEDEYTVVNRRSGKTWRAKTDAVSVIKGGVLLAIVGRVFEAKRAPDDSDVTKA